jgi:hypothetical protein
VLERQDVHAWVVRKDTTAHGKVTGVTIIATATSTATAATAATATATTSATTAAAIPDIATKGAGWCVANATKLLLLLLRDVTKVCPGHRTKERRARTVVLR